jgi:hypothetical protein
MTVTRGPRSRAHWLRALSTAVVASIFSSIGVLGVHAQAPEEDAEPKTDYEATESPIQPADTPTVGVTGNPSPVVTPAPPPPSPGSLGPALIPDGEAPPGPVAPAFPPVIPNIDYAGRLRVGFHTLDAANPKKFSDIAGDLSVDIYFTGAIHRMVKWQVGVTGQYTGAGGSSNLPATTTSPAIPGRELGANAQILDVIARFEFLPEFNLYAGRMIVVADRYTPSGPWGMDEWYYPGVIPNAPAPALMRSGPVGRDLGVNIWGAPLGGTIKYYLGAYQFSDPNLSPLFSGRVQVSLLTPEPGFYHRTTYYGYKDLISLGVGAQYQHDGSVVPPAPSTDPIAGLGTLALSDYNYFTGDIVIDKILGSAGTVSLVGSYSKFGGDARLWDSHFLASIGYLIPGVIGIGKLRPSVRFQGFSAKGVDALSTVLDVQLGYVIMPWFVRVAAGYRRSSTDLGKGPVVVANQLFIGVTLADP